MSVPMPNSTEIHPFLSTIILQQSSHAKTAEKVLRQVNKRLGINKLQVVGVYKPTCCILSTGPVSLHQTVDQNVPHKTPRFQSGLLTKTKSLNSTCWTSPKGRCTRHLLTTRTSLHSLQCNGAMVVWQNGGRIFIKFVKTIMPQQLCAF
jgi:hypothetical protein